MLKTPGQVKKKKNNEGMDFPACGGSSLIESSATL